MKFLLGNLYDYDPEKNRVDTDNLTAIDRYMAFRLGQVLARVRDEDHGFFFNLMK